MPEAIIEAYQLELMNEIQPLNIYTFRITDFSQGTPYEIAQKISEEEKFQVCLSGYLY